MVQTGHLCMLSADVIQCRPPWLPTDRHPQDLDKGANAAAKGFNPNDPKTHPSLLMYHTKYGTLKNPLRLSDPGPLPQFGLSSARRRKDHRALNVSKVEEFCSFIVVYTMTQVFSPK